LPRTSIVPLLRAHAPRAFPTAIRVHPASAYLRPLTKSDSHIPFPLLSSRSLQLILRDPELLLRVRHLSPSSSSPSSPSPSQKRRLSQAQSTTGTHHNSSTITNLQRQSPPPATMVHASMDLVDPIAHGSVLLNLPFDPDFPHLSDDEFDWISQPSSPESRSDEAFSPDLFQGFQYDQVGLNQACGRIS